MSLLTPHKIAERAATRLCGTKNHPNWFTEYGKVKEFLRLRNAVQAVEADAEQSFHDSIMEDINGSHGQG